MYFDTPRDYIGGVYDEPHLRRPAARLGHHRPQGNGTRRDARDVPRLRRPLVQAVAHGGRRRGQARDGDVRAEVERLFGDLEPGRPASPTPRRGARRKRAARQGAHEAVGPGAPDPRRPEHPARASRPLHPAGARDRARRRHVVAPLHRGARAARPRVLRLRRQPQLHRRGLALLAGRRRHQPHRRSRDDDRRPSCKRIVDEPVPADELDKAKNFAKGRFVLQLENPQGLILFGLRREVLEGDVIEPDEVMAALDAVTAEDVQRVAQDVIGVARSEPSADRAVRRRRAVREAALARESPVSQAPSLSRARSAAATGSIRPSAIGAQSASARCDG